MITLGLGLGLAAITAHAESPCNRCTGDRQADAMRIAKDAAADAARGAEKRLKTERSTNTTGHWQDFEVLVVEELVDQRDGPADAGEACVDPVCRAPGVIVGPR